MNEWIIGALVLAAAAGAAWVGTRLGRHPW